LLPRTSEVYRCFSNRFAGETKKVKFVPSSAPLAAGYTLPFPLLFHLIPVSCSPELPKQMIHTIFFLLTPLSQGEYLKINLLKKSKYILKGDWTKRTDSISREEAAAQTNMTSSSISL